MKKIINLPPISNSNNALFCKISDKKLEDHFNIKKILSNHARKTKFKTCKIENFNLNSWDETETIYSNSDRMIKDFQKLSCDKFTKIYNLAPNLLSSIMIFPSSGTCPKMIQINQNYYVIVNIKQDKNYVSNFETLKGIFYKYSNDISVLEEIGVIQSDGTFFFISKYCGYDIETLILDFKRDDMREELLEVSKRIERILRQNNLFWRNISPRNIIKGINGKMYIIDYDNLEYISSNTSVNTFKADQNRRLWFADIFDNETIKEIFIDYEVDFNNLRIEPNEYDRPFISKDCTELNPIEYVEVFRNSALIEMPKESSNNAYGHLLGRFISDYWEGEQEIEFAKFVYEHQDLKDDIVNYLSEFAQIDQETCLKNSLNHSDSKFISYDKFKEYSSNYS